jgi:hypothetical protein
MEYKIGVQLSVRDGVVKSLFTTTVSVTLVGPSQFPVQSTSDFTYSGKMPMNENISLRKHVGDS